MSMTEDQGRTPETIGAAEKIFTIHKPAGEHRQSELDAFEAYWNSMRRDGDVPLRTEIDPRGIESLLSNAFVTEKIAPGLARLRIAGTHLCDVMGLEVRGMPLSALIEPEDRDRLADALVDLFERPAILKLSLTAKGNFGKAPLTGTMLILPLRSDLGDISRALGCLVTQGVIGSTPRRFRITHCDITPVNREASQELNELAEPQTAFTAAPAKDALASERSYLKLVRKD